jgi:hypothetical protein
MRIRLREVLRALWTAVSVRRAPSGADGEEGEHRSPRSDARARFWSEFREGQREADARARPR